MMSRHTTFRYRLDPTAVQHTALLRHAGAARFAFNQCRWMVKSGLTHRKSDPSHEVPWTGFSLINAFNAWKKTEAAGRVFAVDSGGVCEISVTGLVWRDRVCQKVFEEAAVDCARAAFSASRAGTRTGARVGFPKVQGRVPHHCGIPAA